MSGQISENTVLEELSARLDRPVEAASRARARLHLLDWIGCAVAGATEPAGNVLRRARGGDAAGLAFCWGGLGNILEMDDVDKLALLHPGPSIIPVAVVMADLVRADRAALLAAIVKGYEATIRLGRAVGPGHYAVWHNTGTCGAIGAAVACAELLGLRGRALAHAMALAMSQASGLWQTRHESQSMGKQLHTAHAARAGFEAARLAEAGFTGPLSILEGEQGFFAATCPDGDPQEVLQNYDSDWLIHEVSFKPWPACRHAHAVIDAALVLREQVGSGAGGKIDVRTYGDALKFCDRPNPATVIEAKFSLQHAVAVCLARGAPKLEDFSLQAISDPQIVALRDQVRVSVGEAYEAVYPARFGGEVSWAGKAVSVPDALGDPENPISEAQILEKAQRLMRAGGLEAKEIEALSQSALGGDDPGNSLFAQLKQVLS